MKDNKGDCLHIDLKSDGWSPPIYKCEKCGAFGFRSNFVKGQPIFETKETADDDEPAN